MADKYVPINGQVYSTNIDGKAVAASRVYDDANEQFLNETIADLKEESKRVTAPYYHYTPESDQGAEINLKPGGVNKIITKITRDSKGHIVGVESENLPAAAQQLQSDWNQADTTARDFIKNKPNIPDVSGKADKSEMSVTPGSGADHDKTTIQLKQDTSATVLTQHQDISGKQDIIQDLSTIRSGAAAGATAYQVPILGIPPTDMTPAVRASLEKAEAAAPQSTTYTKSEVNGLVTTPHENFASVEADQNTSSATDILPASGLADTIYRVGNWDGAANSGTGQYDVTKYTEYAWNGTAYVMLAVKSQVNEIFDISEYNNSATYNSLANALGVDGANVPASVRSAGMIVKYVDTASGEYVWYRLISDTFTTDVDKWSIFIDDMTVNDAEFVYVITDKENRIICGARKDGDFFFGAGVPKQILDSINSVVQVMQERTAEIEEQIDGIYSKEDIDELLEGNDDDIPGKVDKEEGKTLIASGVADAQSVVEGAGFLQITTDSEGKIVEGIKEDGTKVIGADEEIGGNVKVGNNLNVLGTIDHNGTQYIVGESSEWLKVIVDKNDNIIAGIKYNGQVFISDLYGFDDKIDEINEYLREIEEMYNQISETVTVDERLIVPDYYKSNSYLQNKISRINDLIIASAGYGESFVWTTDEHWERNAQHTPAILRYLAKNTNLNKYFSGGDSGHQLANIEFGRLRKDAFGGDVYPAIGNHEYLKSFYQTSGMYAAPALDNRNAAAYFMYLNDVHGNILRGYYYKDNYAQKVRYIVLNSFEEGEEVEDTYPGGTYYKVAAVANFELEQINWLQNEALAVESGWKILVFSHRLMQFSYEQTMTNPSPQGTLKDVLQILLRYNGNGEIVALYTGHFHRDGIVLLNDAVAGITTNLTGKTIPIIFTTCDAYNFDDLPGEELENRTLGTITEQALDVDVVDFQNKIINIVRIGAPSNLSLAKSGNLEEVKIYYNPKNVSAGSGIMIDSNLQGNLTWETLSPAIASVSNGYVTGVRSGSTVITVHNNNMGEVYIVKVN